jgi:hypothetical protein
LQSTDKSTHGRSPWGCIRKPVHHSERNCTGIDFRPRWEGVMSSRTIFLSRLIGLYCLLVVPSMLVHRQGTVDLMTALLHNLPLMWVLSVITLTAGLAMVLAHRVWSGGALPVVVTLCGWAAGSAIHCFSMYGWLRRSSLASTSPTPDLRQRLHVSKPSGPALRAFSPYIRSVRVFLSRQHGASAARQGPVQILSRPFAGNYPRLSDNGFVEIFLSKEFHPVHFHSSLCNVGRKSFAMKNLRPKSFRTTILT